LETGPHLPKLLSNIEGLTFLGHGAAAAAQLSKPRTGTTRVYANHGTQFGVPMREELVTLCVGMRGDAGQVK